MAKLLYTGTGRRKSSIARVRLIPGKGNITVNKKSLEDYFGMEILKREVRRPFEVAGVEGKFDVIATVKGGGFTGQAGALRHGISRALAGADREAFRALLKAAGFLTRDPRMKEERNTDSKKQEKHHSSQNVRNLSKQNVNLTRDQETPSHCGLGVFICLMDILVWKLL